MPSEMENKHKPYLQCSKVHKDISYWKFWLIDNQDWCYKSHQLMWRLCFRILPSTTVGIISLLFLIFQRKLCWRAGHNRLRREKMCVQNTLFHRMWALNPIDDILFKPYFAKTFFFYLFCGFSWWSLVLFKHNYKKCK